MSTIDKLGPGVEGLAVGQRVFAHNPNGGNWSQYAAVPAMVAWPVPDDLPDEQIASLMINPATAILMVRTCWPCRVGSGCCSPPRARNWVA